MSPLRFRQYRAASRNLAGLIIFQFLLILYVFSPVYFTPYVYSDDIAYTTDNKHVRMIKNSTIPWLSSSLLPRAFTSDEHGLFMDLLVNLDILLRSHNITYMMFYGVLLGSYMMHDLIPWDSDVDVLVKLEDMDKLINVIKDPHLMSKYGLAAHWHDTFKTHSIKIHFNSTPLAGLRPWSWPFIDLQFYGENDTHVWNTDPVGSGYMLFKHDIIYPLTLRPIGAIWLPAPRNSQYVLQQKYGKVFQCMRGAWNHKEEAPYWTLRYAPCDSLTNVYPFVRRKKATNKEYVIETLYLGGFSIYTLKLKEQYQEILSNEFSI